ncbi:C40 family peptidase [Neolewinella agarilytica]|uniref:C40 family peptidase n=1 Tax=Neolewinella agarilytica TaxID=478744 RepID=UPI0023521DD9|nr:C40 family peptidase [Neolewinella agarilytica]
MSALHTLNFYPMAIRFLPALFLCLLLFSCLSESDKKDSRYSNLNDNLVLLSKELVADRRTDRAEFVLRYDEDDTELNGYTTLPVALDSLQALLRSYPEIENKVRLLPDAAVGNKTVGIIKVSVANLRSEPGHSQELATQALLGTPIEVLDLVDNWCLVRTPDRYIAWLEPGAFTAMTVPEAKVWLEGELLRLVPPSGFLTVAPGGTTIISDLVAGNLLRPTGRQQSQFLELALPDNTLGWAPKADFEPSGNWQSPDALSTDRLLEAARKLAGRPYLWGGTSPKGMDCSGFTKTAYYLNGYVIPRDASQQVHAGVEVELTDDFKNLEAGDLLFFGRFREDGSEKITHVGVYLGDGQFLHAGADNGRITTNSLRASAPDYAEHRLKSLLRARRLSPDSKGVLTVNDAFRSLLTK